MLQMMTCRGCKSKPERKLRSERTYHLVSILEHYRGKTTRKCDEGVRVVRELNSDEQKPTLKMQLQPRVEEVSFNPPSLLHACRQTFTRI